MFKVLETSRIVANKSIHVRIDDGDGRRGRHHGLERVAPLAQHPQPGFRGEMVGGAEHAPAGEGGVEHYVALYGSAASRSPSPMKLNASTATMTGTTGSMSHG